MEAIEVVIDDGLGGSSSQSVQDHEPIQRKRDVSGPTRRLQCNGHAATHLPAAFPTAEDDGLNCQLKQDGTASGEGQTHRIQAVYMVASVALVAKKQSFGLSPATQTTRSAVDLGRPDRGAAATPAD